MTWFKCQFGNGGGGSSSGDYTDTLWDGSVIANTYIDTNTGNQISYNGWSSTDYLDLQDADVLYRTGGMSTINYNAFYNSNKTYISGFGAGTAIAIPSTAKYARLSAALKYIISNKGCFIASHTHDFPGSNDVIMSIVKSSVIYASSGCSSLNVHCTQDACVSKQ